MIPTFFFSFTNHDLCPFITFFTIHRNSEKSLFLLYRFFKCLMQNPKAKHAVKATRHVHMPKICISTFCFVFLSPMTHPFFPG